MIGNNSCGVHSVMAGETVRQRRRARDPDLRRHCGCASGATTEDELPAIIAAAAERGEIYARLRELRDRYADAIRARFPQIPRRVSGYNLDDLLPENGFHVARALVGTEGTCVTILEATLQPRAAARRARSLLVLGYPDVYRGRRPRRRRSCSSSPIGARRASTTGSSSDMKKKGIHPEDVKLLPDGRRLAAGRVRRRHARRRPTPARSG